jgi:hypothetical protein
MMVDQADNEGRGPEYTRAMVVRDQLRAYVREQRALARELSPEERAARTRYMAIFCHMGVLFGIPVFVIPMVERRDPALLKHAKAAAITFIIFHIAMIMAIGASAVLCPGSGWRVERVARPAGRLDRARSAGRADVYADPAAQVGSI